MRVPRTLCLLAVLLLLVAPSAPAQADCTGTSAAVSISSASFDCSLDDVNGNGSWSVSGADGVYIEYLVDGTLYQVETRYGVSGTWTFADDASLSDGFHTLVVNAYPLLDNGSGQTICLQHGDSDSRGFWVDCVPDPLDVVINECSWSCDFKAICYGTCSGAASGGTPSYTFMWGSQDPTGSINWQATSGPSIRGSVTSPTLSCRAGYAGIYDTIVLKVEDSTGAQDTATYSCGNTM